MNGSLVLIASLLMGAGFEDFNREKAAVLITSAEMNQVHHGVIEAYYDGAFFWHHKDDELKPNQTTGKNGFLSLVEKRWWEAAIPAVFNKPGGALTYHFFPNSFVEATGGILPANHLVIGTDRKPLPAIVIKAEKNLSEPFAPLLFIPGPAPVKVKEGETPTPIEPDLLPPAAKTYLVRIGSREALAKTFQEFSEGIKGKPEAGQALHAGHYATLPLLFEIVPTSPVEEGDRPSGTTPMVKGWFLSTAWSQTKGKAILPIIREESTNGTKAMNRRSPIEIDAPKVTATKTGIQSFELDLEGFINSVLIPKVRPSGNQEGRAYECTFNNSVPTATACRKKTDAVGKEKFVLDFEYLEKDTPEGRRARNTFTLRESIGEKTGRAPREFYKITLLPDPDPEMPHSEKVPPVRERSKQKAESEDLK